MAFSIADATLRLNNDVDVGHQLETQCDIPIGTMMALVQKAHWTIGKLTIRPPPAYDTRTARGHAFQKQQQQQRERKNNECTIDECMNEYLLLLKDKQHHLRNNNTNFIEFCFFSLRSKTWPSSVNLMTILLS